jgi:hypothetical protein
MPEEQQASSSDKPRMRIKTRGKVVYLMRGLPACGKSTTAKALAGTRGLVLETDEYFLKYVGNDPQKYDFREELLDEARRWNFERFKQAVRAGHPLIIVDRGNSLNLESHMYARFAADHGYRVELKEPLAPWWQELRVLLKYMPVTNPIIETWAEKLSELSRRSHRVSVETIRRWALNWQWDVTVEDILNYKPCDPEEEAMFQSYMETDLQAVEDADGEDASSD